MHEILEKGTACDIARAPSGLHDRADELLTYDVIKRTLADLGHAVVSFKSSNFVTDDVKKTVGELQFGKFIYCCWQIHKVKQYSTLELVCMSIILIVHCHKLLLSRSNGIVRVVRTTSKVNGKC